jgi:hypothetical protein
MEAGHPRRALRPQDQEEVIGRATSGEANSRRAWRWLRAKSSFTFHIIEIGVLALNDEVCSARCRCKIAKRLESPHHNLTTPDSSALN